MTKVDSDIKELTIAVMSDLHCHHSLSFRNGESYKISTQLTTDKLRTPVHLHPIESLANFLRENNKIKADLLLCPGDITNQMDKQGLISGWEFVREIADVIGAKEVIATIGNHDADSRFISSGDDIFQVAQGISKSYPIKNIQSEHELWSQGFCFIEKEEYRVLVINSAKFHIDKDKAQKGKVTDTQSEKMVQSLKKIDKNKIQIALCHHNPIDLGIPMPDPDDPFENGNLLLNRLVSQGFDLFIHGHAHHPMLYDYPATTNGGSISILSAGSFSGKDIMINGLCNCFHILSVNKRNGTNSSGTVTTLEYLETDGWRYGCGGYPNLPVETGFGCSQSIEEIVNGITELYEETGEVQLRWEKVLKKNKQIQFLIPRQFNLLKKKLIEDHQLEINYNEKRMPSFIGKQYTP